MKGKLWQDLRAGALCPMPSRHPQFLPDAAQFAGAAFEHSLETGHRVHCDGAEIFFKDGAGVM